MNFSDQFLEELKSRIILSEVISLQVRLKQAGREKQGLCPFHKEKTPSFYVNDDEGFYYCFGCGAKGTAVTFLMEMEGLSFPEAVQDLAARSGVPLPVDLHGANSHDREKRVRQIEIMEKTADFYTGKLSDPGSHRVMSYLHSRGLSSETINNFRLGYAPTGSGLRSLLKGSGCNDDSLLELGLLIRSEKTNDCYERFRDRLMFPICDRKGKVIAFGGRIMGEGQPKYLNSPETAIFHKRYVLYGLHQAMPAIREGQPAILVEGYMDVIAMHQAGIRGAVAPLGTALTEDHIREIWRYTKEPIICFDGDAAGQNAALRVVEKVLPLLKPGYSLRFASLPSGEDPDSLIQRGSLQILHGILSAPVSLLDLIWQHWVVDQQAKTPEQIALVSRNLFSLVRKIDDENISNLYQNEFKKRLFQSRNYKKKTTENNMGTRIALDPSQHRVKILFASLINHPSLIDEVFESLAEINIMDIEIERLRCELFSVINNDPGIDSELLKRHLTTVGFGAMLERLLSNDLYVHASFAKPGVEISKVRQGWYDVWNLVQDSNQMRNHDLKAQEELSNDMNEKTWAKYRAIKQHMLRS